MKITVINKRASTGEKFSCVDGTTVAPGAQHEMTGRTKDEYVHQMTLAGTDTDISVIGELDGVDRDPLICDMNNVADPAGGATTNAGEGFALKDITGAAANVAPEMYLGAFDDADCQTPAADATLNTASAGTIDSGAGTNLLTVTPSATGTFACTLTNSEDTVVYLKAWPVTTDYIIDSSETESTEFTA